SDRFLTANGTPASAPSGWPAARLASTARARARARSPVTAVKAVRALSRSPVRRKGISTTCTAVALPAPTGAPISAGDAAACMGSGMGSGLEHRCRLDLIEQLELPDHLGQAQCDCQVGLDRRLPLRLDRQGKNRSARFDQCVECIFLHVALIPW